MGRLLLLATLLLAAAVVGCGTTAASDSTSPAAVPSTTMSQPSSETPSSMPSKSPSPLSEKEQIESYLAELKRIQDRDAPEPNKVIGTLNALPASPSADWAKVQKNFSTLARFYDKASIDMAVLSVPSSMTKANRLGVRCMRLMYEFTADAASLLKTKQGPRGSQSKLWVPVDAKRKRAVAAARQWAFETRVVARKYAAKDPMRW